MVNSNTSISILFTYKNKILLLAPDIIDISNKSVCAWGFVSGTKLEGESWDQTTWKVIRFTTKLISENLTVQQIGHAGANSRIYHVKLSDSSVNNMQRRAGQRLEFYTLNELKKLPLTVPASNFFHQNTDLVANLL